jgi:hypothetical protein
MWIASVGTRSTVLLSINIAVSLLGIIESTTLLIFALLNDPQRLGQWMIVLFVDTLTLATLIITVLTLNIRQREKAVLHSAMLITNKKGALPLLVK